MIVLLVDPDPHFRRPVRTFLENRGVRVCEADDLAGARAACARSHPSAIVTELFDDPETTVRELRALAPGVPILVWANGVERCPRDRLGGEDGCGFLSKPALPAEVAFALGRVSPPGQTPFPRSVRPPAPELRRWNRERPALG